MMGIKKYLLKFIDFIVGLFLVIMGLLLVYFYSCLHSKINNWLIAFSALIVLVRTRHRGTHFRH